MFTQQMEYDYLKQMFSLARQGAVLIPAQRRYFMRQLFLQHPEITQARDQQNEMATCEDCRA